MNSIKYFYYLSPVHNKINSIVQIVDSISDLQSTVVIVLKNKQSANELKRFLCSKGIIAYSVLTKEDFDKNQLKNGIFIVIPEVVSYFDQKNVNYVISPFVSASYDEMKRKILPFQTNAEVSLVEVIGKNDSSALQGFYKFPEIVITPFDLLNAEKSREVRVGRFSQMIQNNVLAEELEVVASDLLNLFSLMNIDSLQKMLAVTLFAEIPSFDFFHPLKKESKKVTLQLAQGSIDGISPQKMKAYLLSLEGMSFENILTVDIKENTSDIAIVSKQFSKEDLLNYFEQKMFFDQKLVVSSIQEEAVVEPKTESSEEGYREKRFGGRSGFGGGSGGSRYSEDKPRFRERRDDRDGFSSDRRRDSRGGSGQYGERRNSFDRDNSRPFFRKNNDRPFEKRYEDRGDKEQGGFSKSNYQKPFDGEKSFGNSFNNEGGFERRDRDRSSDFRKKRSFGSGGGGDSYRPKRESYGDNKRGGGYFSKDKPFSDRKRDSRYNDNNSFDGGFKKKDNDEE